MIITEKLDGTTRIISISGDIDLYCNMDLVDFVNSPPEYNIESMIISFSEVEYIDSSGIGAMLQIMRDAKSRNIALAYTELTPPVTSLIELTKLSKFFPITEKMDEAKEKVQS